MSQPIALLWVLGATGVTSHARADVACPGIRYSIDLRTMSEPADAPAQTAASEQNDAVEVFDTGVAALGTAAFAGDALAADALAADALAADALAADAFMQYVGEGFSQPPPFSMYRAAVRRRHRDLNSRDLPTLAPAHVFRSWARLHARGRHNADLCVMTSDAQPECAPFSDSDANEPGNDIAVLAQVWRVPVGTFGHPPSRDARRWLRERPRDGFRFGLLRPPRSPQRVA